MERKNNEDKSLVLHTLPALQSSSKTKTDLVAQNTQNPAGEPQDAHAAETEKNTRLPTPTATIPRVISVVEIIKREYLKTLDPSLADSGSIVGLHQYNEIGDVEVELPESPAGNPEDVRQAEITKALLGKNQYVYLLPATWS